MSRSKHHGCGKTCGVCKPHKKWKQNNVENEKPSVRRKVSDEEMQAIIKGITERNRGLLEALAPHDTRDPENPGWMKCGCCRCST